MARYIATYCFVRFFDRFTVAIDLPIFNFDEVTGDAETTLDEVSIGGFSGSGVDGGLEDDDIPEFGVGCAVDKFVRDDVVVGTEGINHRWTGDVKGLDAEGADEHEDDDGGIDEGVGEVVDDAATGESSSAFVNRGVFEIFKESESNESENNGENNNLTNRCAGHLVDHYNQPAWLGLRP